MFSGLVPRKELALKRFALPALLAASLALPAAAPAEEVTWSEHIRPLFEARCAGCHGGDALEYPAFKRDKDGQVAQGKGPRMDSYAHLVYFTGWPDTGALMRRLDDGKGSPGGKAGNMYAQLGDSETERQKNLGLFKAWVGNWTLNRWKDVTKDDLGAVLVPY